MYIRLWYTCVLVSNCCLFKAFRLDRCAQVLETCGTVYLVESLDNFKVCIMSSAADQKQKFMIRLRIRPVVSFGSGSEFVLDLFSDQTETGQNLFFCTKFLCSHKLLHR
jgi:hypothetical protein